MDVVTSPATLSWHHDTSGTSTLRAYEHTPLWEALS